MILDRFKLDGKVAVVTGGTKGIGKAIAMALAEAGADIAVVSRMPHQDIEKFVRDCGRRFMHHSADLLKRDQTKNVIPIVAEQMGGIDILVNNAGIIRRGSVAEYSEGDWDDTQEIDLTAPFILSQAAGRIMLKKGKGKIINIASIMSFQGGINIAAYTTAKHGVAGLTKSLANDWAGKGVNVNAIAPSFFVTDMTTALRNDPDRSKSIMARTPIGRWGIPDNDITGPAVFLASSASDFIHGVVLPVDGGWLAW
jgi:2-deoxy-D-gluconate 3-dehydrogenase